jgi:hypothetical protein
VNVTTMPDADVWDTIEQNGSTCYANLSGTLGQNN